MTNRVHGYGCGSSVMQGPCKTFTQEDCRFGIVAVNRQQHSRSYLEISSCSRRIFRVVVKHIRISFAISVTVTTAERRFSALRCLKTFLHSNRSQPLLTYYMLPYSRENSDQSFYSKIAHFCSTNYKG